MNRSEPNHSVKLRLAALGLSLAAFLVSLAGCGDEQESLHAHDHFVPAHWPDNLGHASQLIVDRLPRANEEAAARRELLDLMSWVPEIAADAELSEQQWNPIFAECEQFRERLMRGFDNALETELQQLAETLAATHTELGKVQSPSSPDATDFSAEGSAETSAASVDADTEPATESDTDHAAIDSQESTSPELANDPCAF